MPPPTPVRSEKTPNKDKGEGKPPGKRIKIEAQSPAVAKAEETEEPPNEKPNHSQKAQDRSLRVSVNEEFAARGNEAEETEEPLGDKPKNSQKVGQEFAARSIGGEETVEPLDKKPKDAVSVDEKFSAHSQEVERRRSH